MKHASQVATSGNDDDMWLYSRNPGIELSWATGMVIRSQLIYSGNRSNRYHLTTVLISWNLGGIGEIDDLDRSIMEERRVRDRMVYALILALFIGVGSRSYAVEAMPANRQQRPMKTAFATSQDRTRIAYDVAGKGPVLMLLHGGGQTRRVWHEIGYVDRLRARFTVVAVDLRGNGESDKPTSVEAYRIDRLCEDLLAVADAAGAHRFKIWGFSYGANVGRYLAARSARVEAMVIMGIPFGAAASAAFRQTILDLRAKWLPVIQAERAGNFDPSTLPQADRAVWQRGTVPLRIAWLSAMLEWPPVEPKDLRCRTLWLVGSANDGAMESVRMYESRLTGTPVTLVVVPGLTHEDELVKVDRVLPRLEQFTVRR